VLDTNIGRVRHIIAINLGRSLRPGIHRNRG